MGAVPGRSTRSLVVMLSTPLMSHAFYCSPAGVRAELRGGADPNAIDLDTGKTALMWLCETHDHHTRERKRMFRYLVEAGASLTATDRTGMTAWDYARAGAARSFRKFVQREYRRIVGRVPSRTMRRADLPT